MLQALITRELEEAAKTLGDRVRQKDATCEVRGCVSGAERLLVKACFCVHITNIRYNKLRVENMLWAILASADNGSKSCFVVVQCHLYTAF